MNALIEFFQPAWNGWGQSVVFLGGAVVVWLLGRAQSIGEIRKLQAELVSLRVNQFEKIITLDEKLRSVTERVYEQLYALLHATQNADAEGAKTAREATQKIFLLEYIGAYFHYTSVGRWVFPEVRYELVDDEIIPFLKTSAMLLEALNQATVLSLTQQQVLVMSDIDFNFALRFARKHTRFWEFERRKSLVELEKRLLKQAA